MIKLSTAIRKGSKGAIQGVGVLKNNMGEYCALGVACRGVGFEPGLQTISSSRLRKVFPFLTKIKIKGDTLEQRIITLNDEFSWSFKRIANYVAKLGY